MKYDTIQHPTTKLWHVAMYEDDDSVRLIGNDGDGFEEKGHAQIAIEILYSEMLRIVHILNASLKDAGAAQEGYVSFGDELREKERRRYEREQEKKNG